MVLYMRRQFDLFSDAYSEELSLIKRLLEIYDQQFIADYLNSTLPNNRSRETINRWVNGKLPPSLSHAEFRALQDLLPNPPSNHPRYDFDFIDLFAGIGGIRRGFEAIRGRCVGWEPMSFPCLL